MMRYVITGLCMLSLAMAGACSGPPSPQSTVSFSAQDPFAGTHRGNVACRKCGGLAEAQFNPDGTIALVQSGCPHCGDVNAPFGVAGQKAPIDKQIKEPDSNNEVEAIRR